MTLLSDKQLGYMREQVLSMLPETAAIQAPTIVSDAGGGWLETWTTKATYPCRLDPVRSTQREVEVVGNEPVPQSLYNLTLPYNADLDENDTIVIDSVRYRVVRSNVNHNWRVSRRALVSVLNEDSP